ncbi:oral-facial-digital syndrome 1 protein homolog isoform X2 [Nematostella vectensis]|uniref:oral-facial-digital syndrome 1 protein homolog isoform X2 n=1 Tax=Nematostella vectensis TaxID=45351 RepID=UPI00207776D6|nr:oral-facial-digital syndrome 1 protein homolog isoform X2 [Nematostella vectensis]
MSDKELSREDLREKLFYTFRNRGVIDSLKSQLRNRLVLELQQTANINIASGKKKTTDQTSLYYQAANSLVANHLENCNFEYTLSVFLPECGTSKDKLFSSHDICHLLKIEPGSPLYNSLSSFLTKSSKSSSFLWELLCQLSKLNLTTKQGTIAVQTEDGCTSKTSIDEKLRSIDKVYSERAEKEQDAWNSQAEQRIIAFQQQCEERKKAELTEEIQRFKSTELARMRVEEKERYHKEITATKDMLEKDYALKAEVLRVKEKETVERLHRQEQLQEEEAYAQRQKMLEEMQAVRDRENEFKRRQELDLKSVRLEEERVKTEADKVRHLQATLKDQEARLQQRIDNEIQRYKLQFQENHQKRTHEMELREAQFRQDRENFERVKSTYMGYYDQLEGKKEELQKIQLQLERERYATASLTQQKEALSEKLSQMKDYSQMQDLNKSLQREVETLKMEVETLSGKEKAGKKTIKELTEKLTKPSPELITLRQNLKSHKEEAKNKEKLSKERQKKLENMLQSERQRCVEYQRLYEEQVLRQKEMERELDDLRSALHHTQTALRMELERRRLSQASISDMQDLVTPSTVPATPKPPHVPLMAEAEEDGPPPDTANMIAHSKDIYDKLEKEAKELEESFRRFKTRMNNPGQFPLTLSGHNPVESAVIPPTITTRASNSTHASFMPLSGTRFYALPSFGVSHVTQNTSDDRYSSLPRDAQRQNNTVKVSDLFAKPGSPSVISAPISHSPHDHSSKDTLLTHRGTGESSSAADISRRPLSSTIDEAGKRDNDITTSRPLQPISGQNAFTSRGLQPTSKQNTFTSRGLQPTSARNALTSHNSQPVNDQNAFMASGAIQEKVDDDDSESQRSSEASLRSDPLSVGTLNRPAGQHNVTWKDARITEEAEPNETLASHSSSRWNQTNRFSLDNASGGSYDSSVFLKSQTLRQDETHASQARDDWTKDSVFLKSQTIVEGETAGEAELEVSLDQAWRSHDESRALETREDWTKDSVFLKSQTMMGGETASDSDPSLPGLRGTGLGVSLDHAWKSTASKQSGEDKREREKREREIREREEREWEENKRKHEEARLQREREAREREERELRELQRREEEEHESLAREEGERAERESQREAGRDVKEEDSKEPDIDPVMLQYMQMIQKRKEEEKEKQEKPAAKKQASKEAILASSHSEISQDDADLGSLEEMSGDDGFDWG